MSNFVPLYDRREVDRLLQYWLNGSLDAFHPQGNAVVGVVGCNHTPQGFKAQGLITRFLSDDVSAAIADLALSGEPMGAAVLIVVLAMGTPIEYVARALGQTCTIMMSQVSLWVDRFMNILLNSSRTVAVG